MMDKSSSEALAEENEKPALPEELHEDDALTEPALDEIDSQLSILNY